MTQGPKLIDGNGQDEASGRTLEELRRSQLLLRRVLDTNPASIFVIDRNTRILIANPAMAGFYGLSVKDVTGKLHTEIHAQHGKDPGDIAKWLADNQRVMEEGKPLLVEETGTDVDGDRRVYWTAKYPIEFDPGEKAVLVISRDITVLKRGEALLRAANANLERLVEARTAELQAAVRELETFSYSVSHDLRAPLRGIDGWSQALLEDFGNGLDEKARGYLERVRAECKRMGRLVDDLLRLAQLTKANLDRKSVNLSSLAQKIAARLAETNPERQIEFICQPSLQANADPNLIEVALTNLLSNAWKYTGRTPQPVVEFGRKEDGEYFVRDNGAGFNMAYSKRLFGPFQRLHSASEFPGNGIGLATVQRIIRRHGGDIRAEAQVGQGATFYFNLPDPEPPLTPPPASPEDPLSSGAPVVIPG